MNSRMGELDVLSPLTFNLIKQRYLVEKSGFSLSKKKILQRIKAFVFK